ncbi:unnamed protein product [Linum trigynum]|uniref:Uncharacterized protein n=1 Tax=Linum trigynum TaxID=586398 RepID=A0AAV2FSD2_9ROSI
MTRIACCSSFVNTSSSKSLLQTLAWLYVNYLCKLVEETNCDLNLLSENMGSHCMGMYVVAFLLVFASEPITDEYFGMVGF